MFCCFAPSWLPKDFGLCKYQPPEPAKGEGFQLGIEKVVYGSSWCPGRQVFRLVAAQIVKAVEPAQLVLKHLQTWSRSESSETGPPYRSTRHPPREKMQSVAGYPNCFSL